MHAPINDPDTAEALRPILPPLPKRADVPLVVNPGTRPLCVRDLLERSIRKTGDRNKGILSLCRYFKAAGIPEEQAVAECIGFVRRIPPALTTLQLTDQEIETNVRSVARSVYAGNYPFGCGYLWNLGVACDRAACSFIT